MKFFIFFIPFLLFSLPQNPRGNSSVNHQGNSLEVDVPSGRSIIEWDSCSIGASEKVSFLFPNPESGLLNLVTGVEKSQIDGSLFANGHLLFLNPNGVLIGKSGEVHAHRFLATTLNLSNDQFLKMNEFCFEGESEESLIHMGKIEAADVCLMAKPVVNEGIIHAKEGRAELVAATEVLVRPFEEEKIYVRPFVEVKKSKGTGITHLGEIIASQVELKAEGNVYQLAICQEGKVDALGFENKGGKIWLVSEGGRIFHEGTSKDQISEEIDGRVELVSEQVGMIEGSLIDVSGNSQGGEVLAESKQSCLMRTTSSFLGSEAKIYANGKKGGSVYFLSDDYIFFYGDIHAKGAGFVKVSAEGFDLQGDVFTEEGKLVIDPTDIEINHNKTAPPPSFAYPPSETLFTRLGPVATLNVDELLSQINNRNDVTVTTVSESSVIAPYGGRITVQAPITWKVGTKLELLAEGNIVFHSSVTDQ